MGITQLSVIGAGLFYLFIFLSGIWLTRSGKPFNGIVLTIHKLISLGAVVFLVATIYRINQVAALSAIECIASAVTGLLFLGTIVSGGLVSIDKPMPAAILTAHRITPFLTVFSTAATLYLMLSHR